MISWQAQGKLVRARMHMIKQINQSINQSVNQSINQSMKMFTVNTRKGTHEPWASLKPHSRSHARQADKQFVTQQQCAYHIKRHASAKRSPRIRSISLSHNRHGARQPTQRHQSLRRAHPRSSLRPCRKPNLCKKALGRGA